MVWSVRWSGMAGLGGLQGCDCEKMKKKGLRIVANSAELGR